MAATLRHADKVILLSEQARAALLEVAPTVRTAVVPNPIVVDEEAPGAGSTPPVVLFAGTVGRRKGWTGWSRPGGCFSPRASKAVAG